MVPFWAWRRISESVSKFIFLARSAPISVGGFPINSWLPLRFRYADHPAGNAAPGVARRLRPIVHLLVHNNAAAEDRVFTAQFQHVRFQFQMRLAVRIGFEIAH